MDREFAFGALVLLVCAPAMWISAALPAPEAENATLASGRSLERRAWRSIWLRVLPPCVSFAAVLGWAFQEPEPTGESLRSPLLLILVPFAIVWVRAAVRGARALAMPRDVPAAATIGFIRPRVAVAERVVRALDSSAFRALLAHEEAHARHRDPLRIWLAQVVTDLEWPWPAARSRFRGWLHALELARDEEARLAGADGADLAAALVSVARLGTLPGAPAYARLTGDGRRLAARVERLLSPIPKAPPARRGRRLLEVALTVGLLVGAFLLGIHYGETVVRALPGVARAAHESAPVMIA